jgi:hypothetical protein
MTFSLGQPGWLCRGFHPADFFSLGWFSPAHGGGIRAQGVGSSDLGSNLRVINGNKPLEAVCNNRSVMPLDGSGCTRVTMV